jgi:hypothetical protein
VRAIDRPCDIKRVCYKECRNSRPAAKTWARKNVGGYNGPVVVDDEWSVVDMDRFLKRVCINEWWYQMSYETSVDKRVWRPTTACNSGKECQERMPWPTGL